MTDSMSINMMERVWRKGKLHVLLVGMCIDTAIVENRYSLKKLKIELVYDPATPLLVIYPKT